MPNKAKRIENPAARLGTCPTGCRAKITVAVGTLVAQSPPHRSVRADFPHTALILDVWRQSCLTHACQTLGHAYPALCRWRVDRAGVLLDPRSSLFALRPGWYQVVRTSLRYYTSVRLLRCVHAGCTALRLFPPVCRRFRRSRPGGLPVPVHGVSKRARALRLRGTVRRLAFYRRRPWGLRCLLPVGRSGVILSQLNHPAHLCPCLRFDGCLAAGHARLGVRMGRYSFHLRLFPHSTSSSVGGL